MAQNLAPSSIDPQTGIHPFDLGSYRLGIYQYDQLNRIKQSKSGFYENEVLTMGNKYLSNYSYDANGNITHLKRKDQAENLFDDFSYNYNTDAIGLLNNKLRSVNDVNSALDGQYNDITAGQSIDNYQYDEIGNLIADESEEIEKIHWTVYGKVARVERKYNSYKDEILYYYDAMGNRVAKTVLKRIDNPNISGSTMPDWDSEETTLYVRDASGNVMATYLLEVDDVTNELTMQDKVEFTLYGSSRLGIAKIEIDEQLENLYQTDIPTEIYVKFCVSDLVDDIEPLSILNIGDKVLHNGSVMEVIHINTMSSDGSCAKGTLRTSSTQINEATFARTTGKKMYELSNHLGNVGVVISDMRIGIDENNSNTADYYLADVLNATDVYPFGMPMPGRSYTSENYRFGFNGMEKDDEWKGSGNSLDFGARIYDSRLGRWLSRDPLAAYFPTMTPYQFAGNSPILMVDVGGNENMIYLYVSPCLNIENQILLAKVQEVFAKMIEVNSLNIELGVILVDHPMEKKFLDDTDVSGVVGYVEDLNELKFEYHGKRVEYPHDFILRNGEPQGNTPKIKQFPSYTFYPYDYGAFKVSSNVIDQVAWTVVHEAVHRMQQNFEGDKIKEMNSASHVKGANEDNIYLMGDASDMLGSKGLPKGNVNTWDDALFRMPDDWNNFMNFHYGKGRQMYERNGEKKFKRNGQGVPTDNASKRRNGGGSSPSDLPSSRPRGCQEKGK